MLIKNGVDIYATNSLFVKVTNDTIADNVTDASGIVKNTTVQSGTQKSGNSSNQLKSVPEQNKEQPQQ